MAEGTIKKLPEGKDFGFLTPDDGGDDVYFRFSWLKGVTPREGLRVQFEIEQGDRGPRARNLKVMGTASLPESITTADDTSGYCFLNPYNFVRYLEKPGPELTAETPEKLLLWRCSSPPRDRYVGLTGRITCKVEAVTPLFISDSHAVREENGHKTYRFFQLDGKLVLPASSLRGMFRSVFEAVTNSCFVAFDGNPRLPYRNINAARRMKPGVVKTSPSDGKPGLIALCKEAAVGAYLGSKRPLLLDSSWGTGEKGFAIIRRTKRGVSFVANLSKTQAQISRMGDAVEGWLKITGENIDTKLSERFFYQPASDTSSWVEFCLERQQDYNDVFSQQLKEPGFASTHQHTVLTPGDLVYVELESDGKMVKNIAATKVPRLRYRTPIGELLRPGHLHQCKDPVALCPACRMFGWVWDSPPKDADRVAYAGRVRLSHGTLIHSEGELPETTLAILSTPKPTTTLFYLLDSNGEPDATVNYDTPGARLRGRKFYRHHDKANPAEYTSNSQSDQNRTVRGALKPGATFTFTLDFENLAPLELGALLYALELEEGMFHRLGYAKPLGFGSVKVTVESVQAIDWETRLQSVEPNAGWQTIDGAQYKQQFLKTMQTLYGDGFSEVLADLRALLGAPRGLPIHYPRPKRQVDPDHPQYEWFMGNKRRIERRSKRDLPEPVALAQARVDVTGLPLIDKDGKEGQG